MAARKRKTTRRRVLHARRNPVNPVNPARRRARRRTNRSPVYARRRNPVNPARRRRHHHRRRHNPLRGASGEILNFAGAGIALGLFQPVVSRFAGPYLPLGQYSGPAITALSGWGLSKILEMFPFTRRFAHPALVLGFSTAVIQIVQPIVSRTLAGVGAVAPANPTMGRRGYRGMRGIGVMTNIPPGIGPAPLPQANQGNQQGIQGIGIRPGNWGN